MILNILLIVVFILSLLILIFIVAKKIPQLKIMDPESSSVEKSKDLKNKIIKQRIERAGGKHVKNVENKLIKPIGIFIQNIFRRIAGKLTAVERRYQEKNKMNCKVKMTAHDLKELVNEGKKLMTDELWDSAEKKFIEVIGVDAKNIDAYENLGRLYLLKKDYQDAKNTFEFLLKLSVDDPSVTAYLGEVSEKLGEDKKAVEYYKKAVDLSPKNPKYLDFYIDALIKIKDVHEATSILDKLKEVNPENGKIDIFEKNIKKIQEKV